MWSLNGHVTSQSHSTHVTFSPLLFLHLFHSLPELVHEHFLLLFQSILKINLLMTQLKEGRKGEGREEGRGKGGRERGGKKEGEKKRGEEWEGSRGKGENKGREKKTCNTVISKLMKSEEEGVTCSSVACLVSVSFSSLSIFFVSLLICCSCSCSNVCSSCTFSWRS